MKIPPRAAYAPPGPEKKPEEVDDLAQRRDALLAIEVPEARDPPGLELARTEAASEETALLLHDVDIVTSEALEKARLRHFVPRRRLEVDKDAPQNRRKRARREGDTREGDSNASRDEIDLEAIAEAIASADDAPRERAHLFLPDEIALPGDPRLADPDEARRALGSPQAYARHVLILGEAFRLSTGATRSEVIAYIASMFVALSDRAFARKAFREFGGATGIVEIYPLEIAAHFLVAYPGFLRGTGWGYIFAELCGGGPDASRLVVGAPGAAIALEYRPDLLIRGFAIEVGSRVAYRFEPAREPGRYELTFEAPCAHSALVMATTKSGFAAIDRFAVRVGDEVRAGHLAASSVPALLTVSLHALFQSRA